MYLRLALPASGLALTFGELDFNIYDSSDSVSIISKGSECEEWVLLDASDSSELLTEALSNISLSNAVF